jgi:very-short-patch-repair endonuclease
MNRRAIERAVTSGGLVRVRKGRYLPGSTQVELVRAARLGGRIDCVSLLRLLDVHVLDSAALHVQVTNGASRLPVPDHGVVRHWRPTEAHTDALLADVVEALAQACRCQSPRDAVATLDSAWRLGLVDEAGLAEVFTRLPRRYGSLRPLLDRRAESGQESIMRLILRSLGCSFEVQVRIPGVGRVDFVVDGWLIVECDSRAHHEGWQAQRRDRRRDLAAARLGYTTVRPLAEDVLYRRDEVVAALREVTSVPSRRRHELLTPGAKRRVGASRNGSAHHRRGVVDVDPTHGRGPGSRGR